PHDPLGTTRVEATDRPSAAGRHGCRRRDRGSVAGWACLALATSIVAGCGWSPIAIADKVAAPAILISRGPARDRGWPIPAVRSVVHERPLRTAGDLSAGAPKP